MTTHTVGATQLWCAAVGQARAIAGDDVDSGDHLPEAQIAKQMGLEAAVISVCNTAGTPTQPAVHLWGVRQWLGRWEPRSAGLRKLS